MKKLTPLFVVFLTAGLQIAFSQGDKKVEDFFDVNKVQDIKITFPQSNWSYILDSLRFNGNGMLEGSLSVNGQKLDKVGIRYRGSKSFSPGSPRNPFHIELDYKNKDQNLQGYKTIKLSNTLRDPSMIREVLGYEIARNYMPAPKANYARVTINGKYYGLLVNVESVEDPQFLKRYFGSNGNAFFKVNQEPRETTPAGCKSNLYGSLEYDKMVTCYENNFEKISEHGTMELMESTRILTEEPGKIESILNVDNALWMLAFNNIIVNLSSYTGQHSVNYYLYQDDKGRFTPIIWDLNLAFGSFKNIGSGSDLKFRALAELDPLLHIDNPSKPLISKLLENEEYKKAYLSHLRRILYDYFANGKYDERAKALQTLIKKDVESDPGKSYTNVEFGQSLSQTIGKKSKIPGIVELMTKRISFLKAHPALSVFPPDITDIAVAKRKPLSNQRVENFQITAKVDKFPKKVTLVYQLSGSNEFRFATMLDDGKNDDGTADNGIFGTTIVPQNGEESIQYYIVAENAGLISFSPANYMWEQHTATLENLNK